MQQVLWRIPIKTGLFPDGIPIYGFGMMLFVSFLVCTWLAGRRAEKEGIRKQVVQDLAGWLLLGGIIGARLTSVLFEYQGQPKPRQPLILYNYLGDQSPRYLSSRLWQKQ